MVEVHKSCRAVHSEADAKVPATLRDRACNPMEQSLQPHVAEPATLCPKVLFERYSAFLLATLSIEVDRLEHLISSEFPEFKYIDLEIL